MFSRRGILQVFAGLLAWPFAAKAKPPLLGVATPCELSDEDRKRLLASIKALYRGAASVGCQPIMLDGMVKGVKVISVEPYEMDFVSR
jgi:hypothetical protein